MANCAYGRRFPLWAHALEEAEAQRRRLEPRADRGLDPERVEVVALEDFLRRRKPLRMALVLQNLVKHLESRGEEAGKAETRHFAHLGEPITPPDSDDVARQQPA